MIFFTSDHHFNHRNAIQYCNRPFSSVYEMNSVMINNWNSVVHSDDTVYYLGDFCFGKDARNLLLELKGTKILVEGNHDRPLKKCYDLFKEVHELHEVNVYGVSIVLCHYKMWCWNKSHWGSWHCYGHSHGKSNVTKNAWDVGVDNNNFFPVSFEQLKAIIESQK